MCVINVKYDLLNPVLFYSLFFVYLVYPSPPSLYIVKLGLLSYLFFSHCLRILILTFYNYSFWLNSVLYLFHFLLQGLFLFPPGKQMVLIHKKRIIFSLYLNIDYSLCYCICHGVTGIKGITGITWQDVAWQEAVCVLTISISRDILGIHINIVYRC